MTSKDVEAGLRWRLPPYEGPPAIDIYVVNNPSTPLKRAEQHLIAMIRQRIEKIPFQERDYRN